MQNGIRVILKGFPETESTPFSNFTVSRMGILWNTAPWPTSWPPRPAASRSCTACSPRSWTVVSGRSTAALSARTGGELCARWERDVAVHRWSERAAQLRAARAGLCFGRLDGSDGPPLYVGRVGLTDHDGGTDDARRCSTGGRPRPSRSTAPRWRRPMGVARRRHFQLAGIAPRRTGRRYPRRLFAASHDDTDTAHTAADPALLAALSAPRGSAMRDIVATIQAEQDAVIRLPLGWRGRDRGRPRHREDRGRAAPRGLPALHPPRAAGPPRRAGGRPERPVPRVRRGRAAVARRVGRRVHHARTAPPRRRRHRGGRTRGRPARRATWSCARCCARRWRPSRPCPPSRS